MYIDGDSHYWPLRFIDRVSHPGRGYVEVTPDTGDMIRFGEAVKGDVATYFRDGEKVHAFKEGRWNLDMRVEVMDREGFAVQVLIPDNRPLVYELDHELGCEMARAYNDTVAEDIDGKDRFIGVSWVYLPDVQESITELRRATKDLGLRAVKLMGGHRDGDLDNDALLPFYEEVARLNIPILIHPAARIYEYQDSHPWLVGGDRYQGIKMLPTALGFPLTYMVTIARLIFSGILDRFPTLRFGLFEGGIGWIPWLMATLDHHTPTEAPITASVKDFFKGREKLKRRPSEYFDHFYIAAVSWEKYLPDIVKLWPDHNIIIGSDYDHGDAIATWPHTVEPITKMEGLSEEDREKILGGNAMRLFGLESATDHQR